MNTYMKISRINELIDWLDKNPIGLSWMSPQTEVRPSLIPNAGNGRFAIEDIGAGETVVLAGGIVLTVEEYNAVKSRWNFATGGQIDPNHMLLQMGTDKYAATINHTCKPNCYVSGQMCIKTLTNIKKDEELSVDYGTIHDDDVLQFENCQCGFVECRTYVTGKDWLSSDFQKANRFTLHLFEKIKGTNDQAKLEQLKRLQKIDLNKSELLKKEYEALIND